MLGAGRRVLRLGPSDDRNQVQEHKALEGVHLPGPFRGQGVIVNVACTVCFAGMPLVAAYASSKFAAGHNLAVPSEPEVAMRFPSGENATEFTGPPS
jgi:hypothetical protein